MSERVADDGYPAYSGIVGGFAIDECGGRPRALDDGVNRVFGIDTNRLTA